MKLPFLISIVFLIVEARAQQPIFYFKLKPDKVDSSLLKIQSYEVNHDDSLLIEEQIFSDGSLVINSQFQSSHFWFKSTCKYHYKTESETEIRCQLVTNEDTVYRNCYYVKDTKGNVYYSVEFDTVSDVLIKRSFTHYEYDNHGNVLVEDNHVYRDFSGNSTEGGTHHYQYDSRNRLISNGQIYNSDNQLIETRNNWASTRYLYLPNGLLRLKTTTMKALLTDGTGNGSGKWQSESKYFYSDDDKILRMIQKSDTEGRLDEIHHVYTYE